MSKTRMFVESHRLADLLSCGLAVLHHWRRTGEIRILREVSDECAPLALGHRVEHVVRK
jgi:hypothetical protein